MQGSFTMIKPLDRTGTWRTYTVDNGLPGMRVHDVADDSAGHLWFAMRDNGVVRYDGEEFLPLTTQDGVCSNWVYSVLKDCQDRLWFATMNGVCWYDGTSFHHLEDNGISGRSVQSLYEDDRGRIWCGGIGTVGYYSGSEFHDLIALYRQRYKQPPSPRWSNECRGITQDRQGHLWFGFDHPVRFDGESFRRYEEEEGFPQAQIGYVVGRGHAGKVWIGLPRSQDALYCYDDPAFESVQVDVGGGLARIQCDRDGRGWFCTKRGVLYQDDDTFRRFTPADGLPSPEVRAVFQDGEHRFWFATRGGVGLYDPHSISVFDLTAKCPTNPNVISQLVRDREDDIWVTYASPVFYQAPGKSIARFDGEDFDFVEAACGHDINNCLAVCEDLEGNLWFGGLDGLFRYDGRELIKSSPIVGMEKKSICAIAQDHEGRFLFGYWERGPSYETEDSNVCQLKIAYVRNGQLRTVFVKDEEKDSLCRIGSVIAGTDGEVYFHLKSRNSSGGGFARWHPEDGTRFFGQEDGLMDPTVNDLLIDRHGILWIATNGGLARFDGGAIRMFTVDDGLVNNCVHCLLEDSRGHIWMGTDGGVVRYDGRLFQAIRSPHIGPTSRILESDDGTFWFGTSTGTIVRYRPRHTPPGIRLLQVIADRIYEDPEEVIHATPDRQVVFEYKGQSFSTPSSDMLYIYRLKGHDTDWQPATRDRRAYYQDLPPGDYTFEARSVDRDLNYSQIAQLPLSVQPDPRIEALTIELNSQENRKFIGQSPAMQEFQIKLRRVASTDSTVLIMGETGVGKGLAARVLHALSGNCDGPFIQVNCGALPEGLIDSELFGHERGAFTGAVSRRLGKVELATGGTLFLDEIGDMSLETQARLLRILEERTFERVGGSRTLTLQTRVLAATNRNLELLVSAGDFREDLYYRFQAFPLLLPPLRERREDIDLLANYFKDRMAAHLDRRIGALTTEALEALQAYHWPGNVRELEHTMQRAVIACQGPRIGEEDLGLRKIDPQIERSDLPPPGARPTFPDLELVPLDALERHYILAVLQGTNWKIKGEDGAAARLGLPSSTLYSRMKKLGIINRARQSFS